MDYIVIYSHSEDGRKSITTVSLPDAEHNVADAIAMLIGGRYGVRLWHYAEATPANVRSLEARFEEYKREEREAEERRIARELERARRAERECAENLRRLERERRTIRYWLERTFENLESIIKICGIILGLLYIIYLFWL